jgi:glycosyltransferase involved in cell wall biosynthesis
MRVGEIKVSVIIPCYNHADYLRLCLRSIFHQTFKWFEVIVVDDASTDNTPYVIKEFKDSRLCYVRHRKNLGVSSALNTGINLSRGEFIAIIGADDLMKPDNLFVKVDVLSKYPSIGLVYSNAEIIDEDGTIIGLAKKQKSDGKLFVEKTFDKLLYGNFITASSVMVRKSCFEKVGLFDTELHYAEDWDMWLRLAYFYNFGYVDIPLVQYRLHLRTKSLSQQNYSENKDLAYMERIINKIFFEFSLQKEGYSYRKIYWSNYLRMLNNKLGILPTYQVIRFYVKGIKMYPNYLNNLKRNIIFILRLIWYFMLPRQLLVYLRHFRFKYNLWISHFLR